MIKRPTAFILGAGTSMPYGFPSGGELLRMARGFDILNLAGKLHAPWIEKRQLEILHFALTRTHDSSIDALLELRPDITDAGKRLIASLILELEFHSPGRYPKPEDDWLTVFFDELVADTMSLEDFGKNPITLITYNYDRLLEYRLLGALIAHYGRSEADCVAALASIPILHLHGDLGLLPAFGRDDAVPFGPAPNDQATFEQYVDQASKRLVIVHEASDETGNFDRARKSLQSVKQIVMLGFGFGATNLSRLEIRRWRNAKTITGTTFGMTPSQVRYAVDTPFTVFQLPINFDSRFGTREFLVNRLDIFRED